MKRLAGLAIASIVVGAASCSSVRYDPERATRMYPSDLHTTEGILDIQVFRDGESIEMTNSTTRTFSDASIWINQRYVRDHVSIDPGQTVRLALDDFRDVRGEGLNPGGLFRKFDPTPIRLTELQTGETEPLVGLITIRKEPAAKNTPR